MCSFCGLVSSLQTILHDRNSTNFSTRTCTWFASRSNPSPWQIYPMVPTHYSGKVHCKLRLPFSGTLRRRGSQNYLASIVCLEDTIQIRRSMLRWVRFWEIYSLITEYPAFRTFKKVSSYHPLRNVAPSGQLNGRLNILFLSRNK